MNDFLLTELAREYATRLASEARMAALVREASGDHGRFRRRRRKGADGHPRNP